MIAFTQLDAVPIYVIQRSSGGATKNLANKGTQVKVDPPFVILRFACEPKDLVYKGTQVKVETLRSIPL